MVGTILLYRDDGNLPHREIALDNGDRIRLALGGDGLVIARLAPSSAPGDVLFRAAPAMASRICAGLVGPKRQSEASPLRVLAAAVQRIGSAADVRSAFTAAATSGFAGKP